jgi:hypothetical protein
MFPTLDAAGLDFMALMFVYDPAKRLTVRPGLGFWCPPRRPAAKHQALKPSTSLVLPGK